MPRNRRQRFKSQAGYSIIEITIVLAVIGLILSGVFKGFQLLREARLQKLMTDITRYQGAYQHFQENYQAIPGDYAEAEEAFIHTRNGNGNGALDGEALQPWGEKMLFWDHLKRSECLTQITFLETETYKPQDGFFLPKTSLGGAVLLEKPEGTEGLWMSFVTLNRGEKRPLLTPKQAFYLNQKLDNGDPLSGKIQSRNDPSSETPCIRNQKYNLSTRKACCYTYAALD
jgi:prepilin-type N-terminal cleavage/methylation domain-containing protein